MALSIAANTEPIPGYRLLEPIGRGGFGEVWKAEAPGGILKAIKFVFGSLESRDDKYRTQQELKALTRIKSFRHPFLLSIERFDVVEGQLVIVTELADRDLMDRYQECVDQGQPGIPRPELLRYLEEASEALDLMNNQHDLQHLDIKPQNLCLLHNHIKVADFGLVKDLTGLVGTVTGGLTPLYAAPETFEGRVTRQSDQYSLAVVYQKLLTGQYPFSCLTPQEIMRKHLEARPDLTPLPAADRAAVGRALAKDPSKRFSCCLDFVRALQPQRALEPARPAPGQPEQVLEAAPCTSVSPVFIDCTQFPTSASASVPDSASASAPDSGPDGSRVLCPGLVIGLGHWGLEVLRRLARELEARFGGRDQLAHLRLLGIDTDPDSVVPVLQGAPGGALDPGEVVLAGLARAAHYLRPRDSLPDLQDWLPAKVLHRIPRNQVPNGTRALGRLAFMDHYRTIRGRLQSDLERITAPDALADACRSSGLGRRSGRPRVYIVTSLGGGTGGGMFLDLAYVVRDVLRKLRYKSAEVIGLFALPPWAARGGDATAQANALAALVELNHFASPDETFKTRYDGSSPAVQVSGPAFSRCAVLSCPDGLAEGGIPELAGSATQFLYRELLTPLGREADRARQEAGPPPPAGVQVHTFGLRVLASFARPVLARAARAAALALLERWAAKGVDSAPQVRQEVQRELRDQHLDPLNIMEQLEAACTRQLGRRAEAMVSDWLAPMSAAAPTVLLNSTRFRAVLRQINELLGMPQEDCALQPAPVPAAVQQAAGQVGSHGRRLLTELVLHYLDRPAQRCGAAEEAVSQAVTMVTNWLRSQEEQVALLGARVQQLGEKLQSVLAEAERPREGLRNSGLIRRDKGTQELPGQLGEYAKLRYRQVLHQRLAGVYLSLRGHLSDQVREFGFYRQALDALQRAVREVPPDDPAESPSGAILSPVLPLGCASPDEAAARIVKSLSPDEWARLDAAIQARVAERFNGLAAVLMAPTGATVRAVGTAVVQEVQAFLAPREPRPDVAELFLARQPDEQAQQAELGKVFEAARPFVSAPTPSGRREVNLLLVPATASGHRLADLAGRGLPNVLVRPVEDMAEIVAYRECLGLTLESWERLSFVTGAPPGADGGKEPHLAHARFDIPVWRKLGRL